MPDLTVFAIRKIECRSGQGKLLPLLLLVEKRHSRGGNKVLAVETLTLVGLVQARETSFNPFHDLRYDLEKIQVLFGIFAPLDRFSEEFFEIA